ncbi:MAG: hypothetical protein MUE90_11325 [Thermoanaerobaculales bacterium]|jgi:hypothetical protein|nr:hypothetical protein [Thermoanaerobaculales bacterium]
MKRSLAAAAVVVALLGLAVSAELRLGRVQRADPLGRELLYLPSPEMLKVLSVGNPGLAADIFYMWSIQYYSLFAPHERFLYLEPVYDLITDLDPLYFDAYRIGALIMQLQTGGDQKQLQETVQRLFDKGLANLPASWELAEAAAWDMFMRFRDRRQALRYAEVAAARAGAPARIKRMVGVWRDSESAWTVEDSIAYWRQAVAEAVDAYDRRMSLSKLYDAVATRDREALNPVLAYLRDDLGRCPASWDEAVRRGALVSVPLDYVGNPYGIDPERCELVPLKKISDQ